MDRSRVPLYAFVTRLPPAVLLALASFFLYLLTLAPDVLDSDGGEFQFAAWNFAFVHPTGYPLFLLLGGLFQHLFPIGNPAFRLNVFNAIIAALAVGALYLAAKEITQSRAIAAIVAASFAVSRTFWYSASGVEVYALNAFLLAILIYLAMQWKAAPSGRNLVVFCLTYGLALTHHRAIALWIPAFALFFLLSRHTVRVSRFYLALGALGLLLPLLLYLYIPLRAPTSPYYQLPITSAASILLYDNTPSGFLNYVLGRTFQFELRWDAVSVARLWSTPRMVLDEFSFVGIALGVIGWFVLLWRREWALFTLTAAGFATTVLFNAIYHIGDISAYYIPAYLVWALWIGIGVSFVVNLIDERAAQPNVRPLSALCLLLSILFVPGAQLFSNYHAADRSAETQARSMWTQLLSAPIPQGSILVSNDRDEMMPLWYIQYVEHTRPDLLGLFPLITPAPQYANVGRLTDAVVDSGRPVYLVKPMPGMEIKFRLESSVSPLVRVLGRASSVPQISSNSTMANRVRVLGYDISREPGELHLAIYFQAQSRLDRDYTVFVNLLNIHGGKVAQGNDHQLGGDYYPTSLWQVGETLRDEQIIPLNNGSAGTYRLFVGLYRQPDLEPLGDPAEVGVVELP